jgi:hypothetical protein
MERYPLRRIGFSPKGLDLVLVHDAIAVILGGKNPSLTRVPLLTRQNQTKVAQSVGNLRLDVSRVR